MVKKKLAFVDHNYHKKTRCADFLREIFSEHFIIDDYWWTLAEEGKLFENIKNYEDIFFFQSLIPFGHLLKLKEKNLMWAPMYDNLPLNWQYWKKVEYLNIKLLCFSNKVKLHAEKFNCPNINLKFFFKPKEIKLKNLEEKLNIFFWFRNDLKFNDWIKLFDKNTINKIVYFDCPDPGRKSEILDKETLNKYNIEIIKEPFLPNDKYLKLVEDCDVFISPRKQEGIGMSFLEAISMSKYVVSNNDATMNEYINNKKLGFLINKENNLINKNDVIDNIDYRNQFSKNGYLSWCRQKKEVIDFFSSKLINENKNWIIEILFFIDTVKNFIKKKIKK